MAVVKYITCDRCGRTVEGAENSGERGMTIKYTDNYRNSNWDLEILDKHLCQKCAKEFKIWFKK